ncbi:MAG: RNA methyltransferase [Parvibaculum sp.]|nr:RNA methyltransferase [Parvibaculum sp.]
MSVPFWRLIESQQNPQFKIWNDLADGRGIKKHGLYILSGRKLVPEALALISQQFLQEIRGFHAEIVALLVADPREADGLPIPANVELYRLTRNLMDKLDTSGTNYPLLVGRVPEIEKADLSVGPQGLELIVALGDPNNLGALMRSAAAFGAKKLILMDGAAHPFHPKTLRAAANAVYGLTLARGPSWEELNQAAGPIVALDSKGADLSSYKWPKDVRIVLGEEGMGIPETLNVTRLAIPTTGAVESLNATVAASVALYAHYTSSNSSVD